MTDYIVLYTNVVSQLSESTIKIPELPYRNSLDDTKTFRRVTELPDVSLILEGPYDYSDIMLVLCGPEWKL